MTEETRHRLSVTLVVMMALAIPTALIISQLFKAEPLEPNVKNLVVIDSLAYLDTAPIATKKNGAWVWKADTSAVLYSIDTSRSLWVQFEKVNATPSHFEAAVDPDTKWFQELAKRNAEREGATLDTVFHPVHPSSCAGPNWMREFVRLWDEYADSCRVDSVISGYDMMQLNDSVWTEVPHYDHPEVWILTTDFIEFMRRHLERNEK